MKTPRNDKIQLKLVSIIPKYERLSFDALFFIILQKITLYLVSSILELEIFPSKLSNKFIDNCPFPFVGFGNACNLLISKFHLEDFITIFAERNLYLIVLNSQSIISKFCIWNLSKT